MEKYRQEAEEAIVRQARAEEKLQDSTTEQNEVRQFPVTSLFY